MVGVGPGVGADIIRQRRKRADKLKQEQQVRVINIHGTPTLAAVAPKSKKKDDAHYHWHYTPARNDQIFNLKKADYLASQSNYYRNARRRVPKGRQKSVPNKSAKINSSSQSLFPYTCKPKKLLDVKNLSTSADVCLETKLSSCETLSRGSRSTVYRVSTSFSETSMSSSSSPKITRSGSEAANFSAKSLKSIDSFRTNREDLEKDDDVNESHQIHFVNSQPEYKSLNLKPLNPNSQTEDKPLSPIVQSLKIPKIKITTVESCEYIEFEKSDIFGLSADLSSNKNELFVLSPGSMHTEIGCKSSETMIDEMLIPKTMSLSLNGVNEGKTQGELQVILTDGDETPVHRNISSERKRKIGCFARAPKLRNEVTLTDYHKYVARKTLLDTLRRRHVPDHKQNRSRSTIDNCDGAAISRRERKRFMSLVSSKSIKANSYFNIHFQKDNEIEKKIEANDNLMDETCSLKEAKEIAKREDVSTANKIDTSVTLLNNTRRFSFQQLKDQSKSAISTFQKFIEVTFDRGKSG